MPPELVALAEHSSGHRGRRVERAGRPWLSPGQAFLLSVVVLLVVGGATVYVLGDLLGQASRRAAAADSAPGPRGDANPAGPARAPDDTPTGAGEGEDDALDDVWYACQDGDWVSCDQLAIEADDNGDFQFFGVTCGARDLRKSASELCQNRYAPPDVAPVVLVQHVEVGMCFDRALVDATAYFVKTADCDDAHDVEVMGITRITATDYPQDIQAVARTVCAPVFLEFVGRSVGSSTYDLHVLVPDTRRWRVGSRIVACGIIDPGGPVVGSLRAADR